MLASNISPHPRAPLMFHKQSYACSCIDSDLSSARLELISHGHCAGVSVMISAGAKEVLMAWQLTWRGSHAPGNNAALQPQSKGLMLEHQWLSTRPPPKGGLRPRSNAPGCNSRGTAHRCSRRKSRQCSSESIPHTLQQGIPIKSPQAHHRIRDIVCVRPLDL